MAALRSALANRDLARLLGAFAASALGTLAFMIVLSLYAYAHGGASAVGIAVLVRMAPSILIAPYGALLADRQSRRRVLIAGGLLRAVFVVAVAVAVAADAPFAAGVGVPGLANNSRPAPQPGPGAPGPPP